MNVISIIAASGVVIGSLLLLVVLSGFSGLKSFSLTFSSVIDPDYRIFPASGKRLIVNQDQWTQLSTLDGVASFSNITEEKVFLQFKDKNELATLKGVDRNYNSTVLADSIVVSGQWIAPETKQSITGYVLADKLNMGVFDYSTNLQIFVPTPGKGQFNTDSHRIITVQNVGLFDINEELNNHVIYTSLSASQELLGYASNQVSYVDIKTTTNVDEETLRSAIQNIFNNKVTIKDRTALNDALHKMLNTENLAVYLIFTLILIIALFNVIGSIIMMIIDKKEHIKTLFNLGASPKEIKRIFFYQGILLTWIGGFIGVSIGAILIALQQWLGFIKLPGMTLAYPVELNLFNVILVLATIYILGMAASKIASYRINKKLLR